MSKPFWWAVAAYLVPTFPLGYAWHLVTFGERYERLGMYRDEVIIPSRSYRSPKVTRCQAYPSGKVGTRYAAIAHQNGLLMRSSRRG